MHHVPLCSPQLALSAACVGEAPQLTGTALEEWCRAAAALSRLTKELSCFLCPPARWQPGRLRPPEEPLRSPSALLPGETPLLERVAEDWRQTGVTGA